MNMRSPARRIVPAKRKAPAKTMAMAKKAAATKKKAPARRRAPAPAAGPQPTKWTKDWSIPVFSMAERGRRWAKVRKLMARDGIDVIVCLPNANAYDRGGADARYLTQLGDNNEETTVAFPIEGEVGAWHARSGVWPASNWLAGTGAAQRGAGGTTIKGWLNENPKFKKGTIGITGLDATPLAHIRAAEGEVNWHSIEILKKSFPSAKFVSATNLLGEARWQKSKEEIAFIRKGTEVAEITLKALRAHARAGVSERHVFAQMLFANADSGASFQPMFGWKTGPVDNPYKRLTQPSFRSFEKAMSSPSKSRAIGAVMSARSTKPT